MLQAACHFIGLLETRMLQFDEIIITSCNEGTLPSSKASGNSFIPFDIRFQFNLPTYKDSEAVLPITFIGYYKGQKKFTSFIIPKLMSLEVVKSQDSLLNWRWN